MKKLTAAIVTAIIGISAFAGVSIINLENGDTRLDMRYVKYGSAELLGIECITANNTGDISLSIGKHMDAKKKVFSYTQVYETNLVHVTDWWEYDWVGYEYSATNQWSDGFATSGQGDLIYTTNKITVAQDDYYHDRFLCEDTVFPRLESVSLTETLNSLALQTKLDGYNPGGNPLPNYNFNATTNTGSGVCEYEARYIVANGDISPTETEQRRTNIWGISLKKSKQIEHWHYQTNIVHVGTITNVSWQIVNRTCYKDVINTSLTNGIAINYLDKPIRLFRNDYLRLSCPIESETNPGKFKVILSD